MKALCSERFEDWRSKFSGHGLQCMELTGDTEMDEYIDMQSANVILTTPVHTFDRSIASIACTSNDVTVMPWGLFCTSNADVMSFVCAAGEVGQHDASLARQHVITTQHRPIPYR